MRRQLLLTVLGVFLVVGLAAGTATAAQWRVPKHFATIQAAIDSPRVKAGDVIVVSPGLHTGALVTKSVEIRGQGRAVIDSGPLHPSGKTQGFRLLAGSRGATISNLTFKVDLAIFNGDAVSDVTVVSNRFLNAYQAVTNWGGSGWDISHNEIVNLKTDCGGGIGVLIGDWTAVPSGVVDNLVAHNSIFGTLHVASDDCGGYSGSGIVLYADFRDGAPGAVAIAYNRVIKNKVRVVSDTPDVVDINAVELTDTRELVGVIYDNTIAFNDLRGMANQIALAPPELAQVNCISRNFGEHRRHGHPHPAMFR